MASPFSKLPTLTGGKGLGPWQPSPMVTQSPFTGQGTGTPSPAPSGNPQNTGMVTWANWNPTPTNPNPPGWNYNPGRYATGPGAGALWTPWMKPGMTEAEAYRTRQAPSVIAEGPTFKRYSDGSYIDYTSAAWARASTVTFGYPELQRVWDTAVADSWKADLAGWDPAYRNAWMMAYAQGDDAGARKIAEEYSAMRKGQAQAAQYQNQQQAQARANWAAPQNPTYQKSPFL